MDPSVILQSFTEHQGMLLTAEDREIIELEYRGLYNFRPTSAEELGYLESHHQELNQCHTSATRAEIMRIYKHIALLEAASEVATRIFESSVDEIDKERRDAYLRADNCVDLDQIIVPFDGKLDVGRVCAICRGILGETCDSASVISHPNCRCRGLQIYGKECIEFAFQYSVRCPNCRGNLNDTVLAEQAKEAAKLVYDDQYALLENKLEADYLHLRHKMKKLLRRTKFLKVTRKAHLKHAKTERRKNKSAIKKRALVLYGSTVQAAGWNQDRHVHVFSQEYLYLWQQIMTPALEQLLNWSRVNRSGVSIVEAKVLLHRIDQACRYALNCIHDTLHNTRATKHIEGLLRRCTELLEMYENPNLSNEHALILAEHLKKLCVEIHHPPHISTQTDRKHLIREMETNLWAGNHKLNGNQLKTFRFFHDKSMRPGLDLSREYYLEIMFCGIKNILQNQCLCRYGPTGPSICGLEWLDSLAENCALDIVRTNILSLSQIGDGINIRTPYKEASHLAIWDSIYSVFMLEEELNICRTWKPIGWPEDEELVEDEALYEQNVFDDDEFVMPDIFNEDTHPEDE